MMTTTTDVRGRTFVEHPEDDQLAKRNTNRLSREIWKYNQKKVLGYENEGKGIEATMGLDYTTLVLGLA
jgi:hypothetical protein